MRLPSFFGNVLQFVPAQRTEPAFLYSQLIDNR